MDGSIITPDIFGQRSSGSCVSSRVISGCIWNWCLSVVKSVTVDLLLLFALGLGSSQSRLSCSR